MGESGLSQVIVFVLIQREKELFYIMSRGFNLTEAMKLFVRANFNEILESIKNEELKNQILQEIDRRLD